MTATLRSLCPAGTLSEEQERDPLAVYLVINGPLGMSAGKIAAQAFQACQRLYQLATEDPALRAALDQWETEGTRTCTRVAQTAHVFDRLILEVPGTVMIDEGITEVAPDTATCFASWPTRRSQTPKMLRHKRVQTMRDPQRLPQAA